MLKHKLALIVLMLGLSYLLGVWLRSLPTFSEMHVLTGDDPYLHLRYAEHLLENGALPPNDTLRYYPEGFDPKQELLLVSWFIAAFSWLTGLQPLDVAIWLPAFFAPLIVIPVYLIGKEVTGSRTSGVIAAFLAASAPAFILRSFEGFCDKESFTTPFMFAALALALTSFNVVAGGAVGGNKKSFIVSVVLALISGVLIGVSALGWAGFLFTYLVLMAYALLMTFFGGDTKSLSSISIPYLVVLAVSGTFAVLLTPRYGGLSFLWSPTFLAPLSVSLLLMALRWLRRRYVFLLTLVLALALLVVGWNYVASLIDWLFGSKGLVRSTVAESQPPNSDIFWNYVGVPFVFVIAALLPRGFGEPKSRSNFLFMLSLFIVSLTLAFSETRLLMFLSLTTSIMAGIALSRAIDHFYSKLLVKKKRRFELNRRALKGLALSVTITILVILSTFALPTYKDIDERGNIYYCKHTDVYLEELSNPNFQLCMPYWLQALDWLRENSSPDAVVISWWDYGYLIQYYAKRTTIVDPGNVYEWRNIAIAKFFMSSDEDKALNILNQSFNLEGKEVYVLVSLEEIHKNHAIAKIAGSLTPSFQFIQGQGWVISNPNAVLTKLVLGIEGLRSDILPTPKHFEKVYCNPCIAIYRVIWELA